jgi:hypothetical protein
MVDREDIAVINNMVQSVPGYYTRPPPMALMCSIPSTPSANSLAQHVINSADRLFFISQRNSGSTKDIREWQLVRVALVAMMQSYPSCLDNGQYAINFYIPHPLNFSYNAINQRFWLQYHKEDNLSGPCLSLNTHLIRPSDKYKAYY